MYEYVLQRTKGWTRQGRSSYNAKEKNKENKRHPKKLHERTSIDFMTERTQEKEQKD